MTDIYKQHDKAFANVSAYCITKDGKRVATVAFKFPRDGADRLWAYVHVLGSPMVRGMAGGYGYSKTDAAISTAASQIDPASSFDGDDLITAQTIKTALIPDDGHHWDTHLRDAGFDVMQAV